MKQSDYDRIYKQKVEKMKKENKSIYDRLVSNNKKLTDVFSLIKDDKNFCLSNKDKRPLVPALVPGGLWTLEHVVGAYTKRVIVGEAVAVLLTGLSSILCFIDIDNQSQNALDLADYMSRYTYVEYSKRGIHIFCYTNLFIKAKGQIEMYTTAKVARITANPFADFRPIGFWDIDDLFLLIRDFYPHCQLSWLDSTGNKWYDYL